MRLILIRHGQTPSNVENVLDTAFPGAELTPMGLRQAEAVPAVLAQEGITALYASTLTRTQLTAAPLAKALGLAVQVRPGLREIAAGALEMRGDLDAMMGYLATVRQWLQGDLEVRMDGADTGAEVLARFDEVVREAEEAADGGTVAMVSHGAMIRVWAGCRSANIDWSDKRYYMLENTGFVVLEGTMDTPVPGGEWKILDWTGHGTLDA
ncbi:histidine phosphatase family protein [Pseudarthrobacter sp. P1]|uniref:histidine phosphatase family protein n=1 Tax=Pseudarthrobacter sp. P1 TaxID=3418418 RepID=UPI003CEA4716